LINFQLWILPPSQDIDAIEALGNPGWGWKDYVKYQNKVAEQVKTASPRSSEVLNRMFFDTLAGLELNDNPDAYSGNTVGGPFLARGSLSRRSITVL
jgi:hypothetical protein